MVSERVQRDIDRFLDRAEFVKGLYEVEHAAPQELLHGLRR